MYTTRIVGLVASIALVAGACATRPSEGELAEAILTATDAEPDVELSSEQASCIARELLASDLSDTTLSGLATDFDNPEVLQTELDDVEPLVEAAALACR